MRAGTAMGASLGSVFPTWVVLLAQSPKKGLEILRKALQSMGAPGHQLGAQPPSSKRRLLQSFSE